MSRLTKFFGKPKEIEIENEKFTLYPLKGKHLSLFMKEALTPEEQLNASYQMIYESLLPGISDITIDEIKELEIKIINKLLMEIIDLNGLGEDERVKQIRARIQTKGA